MKCNKRCNPALGNRGRNSQCQEGNQQVTKKKPEQLPAPCVELELNTLEPKSPNQGPQLKAFVPNPGETKRDWCQDSGDEREQEQKPTARIKSGNYPKEWNQEDPHHRHPGVKERPIQALCGVVGDLEPDIAKLLL